MDIETVRRKLQDHSSPRVEAEGQNRAAVAVVLRPGSESAEVLLIERAIVGGDPWSGHMAFPGGRFEPQDTSMRMTASRETYEEVGIELTESEYLGQIDELEGNRRVTPRLVVSAHVFHLASEQRFNLDPKEVQNAFWFPLAGLHERERQVEHTVSDLPDLRFPGIVVGEPGRHVVWGLTFRFLERMLHVLDRPFEKTWGNLADFVDSEGRPLRQRVEAQGESGNEAKGDKGRRA